MQHQPEVIRLLDADPDLGELLTPDEFAQGRRDLPVRVIRIPSGPWDAERTFAEQSCSLGLLMLDGLVLRDVDLGRRSTTELLGQGDLLRPWQGESSIDALPLTVRVTVMQELRLAVLDRRFVMAAARYNGVIEAITGRVTRRSRWLATRLVVNQLVRLEDRLVVGLWALAERFGRVTPEGVLLPLDLTHSTLARLVGARRPSVTSALGVLAREDLVRRTDQGWLLRGDPTTVLEPLTERLTTPT